MIKDNNTVKGMMMAALGYSLFACGDAIFKHLSASYSIYTLICVTGLFSLLVYLVFARPLGGFCKTWTTPHLKMHIARGFLLAIQIITTIYGFAHLSLAKTYALIFLTPILTAVFAIFLLKERASWQRWLAVLMGFAGVLTVLRPGFVTLEWAGIGVLAGAVTLSLSNIMVRMMGQKDETLLSLVLYPQLIIIPLSGFLMFPDFTMPTLLDGSLMALLGIGTGFAFIAIMKAFASSPITAVAPFHYIQILWGVGFGYLIFGDMPDIWTAGGTIVIVASGLWLLFHEKSKVPDIGGP